VAGLNQSKANTDSQRGHLQTQVASLRFNQDLLDRTIAIAPFDGIVTNEPIREGETVVEGIQNAEGSTLMTLADMSIVTAEVKVDETTSSNIQIGQPAESPWMRCRKNIVKGHVTLVAISAAALYRHCHLAVPTGTDEAKDSRSWSRSTAPQTTCAPDSRPPPKITTAHKANCSRSPSRR